MSDLIELAPIRLPNRAAAASLLAEPIMLALLAEIELLGEASGDVLASMKRRGMPSQGVPYCPALWLDEEPLSPAKRMASSRAIRLLAQGRWVRRITDAGRDRVRWLRPTIAGLRWALALAGERAQRAAIVKGLRRTEWGTRLG